MTICDYYLDIMTRDSVHVSKPLFIYNIWNDELDSLDNNNVS